MFKRMSDALKTASNDKNYTIMMILLFLVLVSNYFTSSPLVWFLAVILIVVMIGMIVHFYIKNEVPHEKK